MAWFILTIAGLFEVVWAFSMKQSEGFTRLWPSVVTLAAMLVSFGLLAWSMRALPLGTAESKPVIVVTGPAAAGFVLTYRSAAGAALGTMTWEGLTLGASDTLTIVAIDTTGTVGSASIVNGQIAVDHGRHHRPRKEHREDEDERPRHPSLRPGAQGRHRRRGPRGTGPHDHDVPGPLHA